MANTKHDLRLPLLFTKGNDATVPVLGVSLVPNGDGSLHQSVVVPLNTLDSTLEPINVGILSALLPKYSRREFYSASYIHPPKDVNEYIDQFPEGFSHLLIVLLGFYALGADDVMNGTSFASLLSGWTAHSYPDKIGNLQSVGRLREKLLAVFAENDELPRKGADSIHSILLSEADKGQVGGLLGISPNAIGPQMEILASEIAAGSEQADSDDEAASKIRLVFASSFQQALEIVFGEKLLNAYRGRRNRDRWRSKVVAASALGLLLLVAFAVWWLWPHCEPVSLIVEDSVVKALSKRGKICWSIEVKGRVADAKLAELIHGETNHLVVGVQKTELAAPDEDSGKILVYNSAGKLVWQTQTAEPYPYVSESDNRMGVTRLEVVDLWNDGSPEIVAMSQDTGWFPCKIVVLDHTGKTVRKYWNPGHLGGFLTFDSSKDHRKRILAWGCNNRMPEVWPEAVPHKYFHGMVCLDPETMGGEAPPRHGKIGTGTEEWYGIILPQHERIVGVLAKPAQPGAPAGAPGLTMRVGTSNGIYLYIDESGNCVSKAVSDTGDEKQLESTGLELIHQSS